MHLTIEAHQVWIADVWNGQKVTGVANDPIHAANIQISVTAARAGDDNVTTSVRRDMLIVVDRST